MAQTSTDQPIKKKAYTSVILTPAEKEKLRVEGEISYELSKEIFSSKESRRIKLRRINDLRAVLGRSYLADFNDYMIISLRAAAYRGREKARKECCF